MNEERGRDERVVYVVPETVLNQRTEDEISLSRLSTLLWRSKAVIFGSSLSLSALATVAVLILPSWYKAEAVLAPAEDTASSVLAARMGGLASLAGVNIGSENTVEPVAILRSRDFTRAFIMENELMPILYQDDWDPANGTWREEDPVDQPDIRDAVEYFDESIRSVNTDKDSGLVTLTIEWKDPVLAAEWANALVARINEFMRIRALREAEANLSYLRQQLDSTSTVTLQQSISALLEDELQKAMLARGKEEFAFKVIDSAQVPKLPSSPNRPLIVVAAFIFGALLAAGLVLVREPVTAVDSKS